MSPQTSGLFAGCAGTYESILPNSFAEAQNCMSSPVENDTVGSLLTAQQLDRNPCLMQVGGVYRI